MKLNRFLVVAVMLILGVANVFAQGVVTGQLTGTVTTEGAPLPGVTVTLTSPNLQGARTAVTDVNGNYNFAALPPGDYTVRVELEGMRPVTRTVRVTLSGTARVDAEMQLTTVAETITVTASAPAVLETTEVQSNFQKEDIDNLPVGRNPIAVSNLAPGVTNNGPSGGMVISGSMESDNLIMVNGATVMDNIRGTARPLYVEDAIQETTVMTGAVSAEFGRFTGGVVNTITKSGGNEFSGSLRDSFTNPRWTDQSAAGEARPESTLNEVYEGTLGGRIIRDRLWFFVAGRLAETTALAGRLVQTNQEVFGDTSNTRYELKLTGQITPKHSLMVNYLNNPLEATNNIQSQVASPFDMAAVDPSIEQEEDFKAAHYSGVFTNNLLGEINWNTRTFAFVGFGGDDNDVVTGTPLRAYSLFTPALRGIANEPWFCGVCDTETRDTELTTAKLNYFLGTRSFGTHNIVAGAERYTELLTSNNWQSPTGLSVWSYYTDPVRRPDGTWEFGWGPGDSVEAFLVETPSLGSDLTTDSFFINDKWDLNKNFSFNLGARYDQSNAVDQAGNKTVDEDSISPRLGVTYDPWANGRLRLGATYSNYVGRLAEGVQGAGAGAGDPNWYGWYACDETLIEYGIPCVNAPGNSVFRGTAEEVVRHAITWWQANGGLNANPSQSSIGGVSTQLIGSIQAPDMDEWTIGAGWQMTRNGYVRADYINREWGNFYGSFINQETGQVDLPGGNAADLQLIGNTDVFEREYRAIQLQANQRLFGRVDLGGSYTWSELQGNVTGESSGSGPGATGGWVLTYPEFTGFERNNPTGSLPGDQRHKLRVWAGIDVPLGPAGTINFSALQRFDSGLPYSAVGTIAAAANPAAGNIQGVYLTPPTTVSYFFSDRGEFRWDDITRTDLAVNYRLPVWNTQLFVEGEVLNLFNEQSQVGGATTVITARNSTRACGNGTVRCSAFNPFTTTPVEGTHYAILTPQLAQQLGLAPTVAFGNPTGGAGSFQLARTYQVSVGFRF